MRQADGVEDLRAPSQARGVVHQRRRRVGRFGRQRAGEPIANEIFRQHHGRESRERLGLVVAKPQDFRKRESLERRIGREIAQPRLATDSLRDLATLGGGASVAPEQRGTNHRALRVEKDRRVHLTRDADRRDARARPRGEHGLDRRQCRLPPRFGVLLCPSGVRRRHLERRHGARFDVAAGADEDRLYTARANVDAKETGLRHVSALRAAAPSSADRGVRTHSPAARIGLEIE